MLEIARSRPHGAATPPPRQRSAGWASHSCAARPTATEPGVEFVADDATKLAGYREIPREYDLIFLRHQNVWHDREIWRRIYEFALTRLPEHGYLVITSYFDREHLIALDLLKTLGAEVIASLENPRSRALDYPGKSVDRHLAALRRID